MGNENSREQIDPNTPPRTLSSRSLDAVAEYIKDGRPKRIVVMTGAGISTSAGIPDFRSPDTGLYANLARLDLPYAEAVFDISYFREHPEPFYTLAKELYPGKFFPTIAHSFVALLDEKFMLEKLFTQNIDCLERAAGVPGEKIVEAHGSFATQRCIECKTEFPKDLMMKAVGSGHVPHCIVPQCNGLVKPDIVFFGEQLPESFFRNRHVPAMADLVIVMGTSLMVQPFASLPTFAQEGVPRVLINKEIVGDLGSRPDDVIVLDDCDAGVRKLADALGWWDELEAMWFEVGGKVKEKEAARLREQRKTMTKDELLEEEIEKLTGEVDAALQISKDHTERVNNQILSSESSSSHTPATSPDSEKDQPASKVSVPTNNELGIEEPPSTPATTEKTLLTTEKTTEKTTTEVPAEAPTVDSKGILDVTLPQNRPNGTASDSATEEQKPASRI